MGLSRELAKPPNAVATTGTRAPENYSVNVYENTLEYVYSESEDTRRSPV